MPRIKGIRFGLRGRDGLGGCARIFNCALFKIISKIDL